MKTKILCLLLALVMIFSFAACNEGPTEPNTPGNNPDTNGGKVDTSTTERYLPERLFSNVKKEFEKKNATDFPALDYANAPFLICDESFAGKKITAISLPVRVTKAADAEGKLKFTLHIVKNDFDVLTAAEKTGVVTHEIKIDPAAYGIEANKTVCKYVEVDLSAYNIQLGADQTIAIGAKDDTIQIASMNTRGTTANSADVIRTWRKDWGVTSYLGNLFTGVTGESNGGVFSSRNTLPVDFVFDYGTPEAKKAVVDARKAEEDAYAAKVAALAEVYEGKYLSMMGDSISSFTGVTNDTNYNSALYNNRCYYSTAQLNGPEQMYWGRVAEACGMEICVPNGWSSSRVYGGGSGAPGVDEDNKSKSDNMLLRSTTLHNNQGQKPDVILLYMGTNDISHKTTWSDLYDLLAARGDKSQKEVVEAWLVGVHNTYNANKDQIVPGKTYTSWEAAYALSLERMNFNYPDAEIYIINLTRTHSSGRTQELIDKANTCLAALADYYGATIVDQAKNTVQYENCHLYGADEANPTALHPNLRGQAALAKLIVETMYEQLPK